MTPHQYKRMLEGRRGNNFEYWTERHDALLENGWDVYCFSEISTRQWSNVFTKTSTSSVLRAKEVVEKLRADGNFARIVCGFDKNVQRQKMHSVIYKPKKPTTNQ